MRSVYIICIFILVFTISGCERSKEKSEYRPDGVRVEEKRYIVGIHPYLNTNKMFVSFRPIFDQIESKIPNTKFELETSMDYKAYEDKLYAKKFDFALPNPYQSLESLKHGYKIIAKMKPDTVFRGIFVARVDSNIKKFSQLKNQTLSFPSPTALAATMMPLYFLHENGIDTKNDIKKVFVGSQFSSIMNAYSKDSTVGCTWPPPWEQWKKENPDLAKEMEVVWETKHLVNNGFVARDDIDEVLTRRVANELANLDSSESTKQLLQRAGFEGFEKANNLTYNKVKEFLEIYDKEIGLPK